ncbi:MAG: hypothetical protein DRQ13_09310 [Ignavibacteriae bacterium]|nr:MAG: hypothetical protein DRQ13_09310 [Ignavibacteriota bacterium]
MRLVIFFLTVLLIFTTSINAQSEYEELICPDLSNGEESSQEGGRFKPSENDAGEYFRALIVFVQFQDDERTNTNWPLDELPNWADDFIDDEVLSTYTDSTFSDYWDEMSQDNYDFIGDVYPDLVILGDEEDYDNDPTANYFDCNVDVFDSIEINVDWSDYDNWEFDDDEFVFTEGDADGYVDMIIMIYRDPDTWFTRFVPYGENFTAIASLGSENYNYITHDSLTIRFAANTVSTIGSGITYRLGLRGHLNSIETMAHEFGHYLFGGGHTNYGGIMGGKTYALSGWELNKLGYVAWTVADQDGYTITLGDMITDADLLKIPISGTQTFYLVENHQRLSSYDQIMRGGTQNGGYDWTTTAGSGIYIWLITSGA